MSEFTIGLLGRFQYSPRMRDYFDTLLSRYASRNPRLWIVIDLISQQHLALVERALSLKRICPGLRLLAVVTEGQERPLPRPASLTARRRKRILEAADAYQTLPANSGVFMRVVSVNRFFVARCDLIVYSSYLAPRFAVDNFHLHLRSAAAPPCVKYLFDEFPEHNPVTLEPALSMAQSLDYLRRNRYRVMSDDLPPELLSKWLAASDLPHCYRRLASLDDLADLLRLADVPGRDFLLFRIFALAYAMHRDLWAVPQYGCGGDETAENLFKQFRRLLQLLSEARETGVDIGSYDLLDFDCYDFLLEKLAGLKRLGELSGSFL